MDTNQEGYKCEYHKLQHAGQKRSNFAKQFYEVLLWLPMQFSMRLYKEVKVSCDCPENYRIFDEIVKEAIEYNSASDVEP